MKSHELAKLLLANPDVELICQRDPEGNGYSPLSGVDFDVVYLPDELECYSKSWSADECCLDEGVWEELKELHSRYAVLYPM